MTTFNVSTTAALVNAAHAAAVGDTILVAPGTYSNVGIFSAAKTGTGTVTIKSADTSNPAVLNDLTLANSSNFTLTDLNLSANGGASIGGSGQFQVLSDQNIVLSDLNVFGDPNGTFATSRSGIYIKQSTNVSLTNSTFTFLNNGISHLLDNGLTISGNQISEIYTDGVSGSGTSNITISNNDFSDIGIEVSNTLHPDMIQFFTTNTTVSASNITITGNTFVRGQNGKEADHQKGIYLNDESGNKLPFKNVLIENNTIAGSGNDGISVYDGVNVRIINNTVTSYADDPGSWITAQTVNGLTVTGNAAMQFIYTSTDKHLVQSGNVINTPVPVPPAPSATLFSFAMAGLTSGPQGLGISSASIPSHPGLLTMFAAPR
jgi:parallel beta-helix repeat protein